MMCSASASFILLLFIYWKFQVADGRNRSFFFGVKCMPTSFPIFLLLPILLLPFTASSPTQSQHRHSLMKRSVAESETVNSSTIEASNEGEQHRGSQ